MNTKPVNSIAIPFFSNDFKDLVRLSKIQSDQFYEENDQAILPNPYYIGKGNPNSRILIIGKELGFSSSNYDQLEIESKLNPEQWKEIIDTGMCSGKFDPSYPYNGLIPPGAGHTWSKYEKLYRLVDRSLCLVGDDTFHRNFFYTELNTIPSKFSPGLGKINLENRKERRIEFFKKNRFYQNFNVVILGLGDYLSSKEIKGLFDVELYDNSQNKPRQKFVLYSNPMLNKLVIHTRQLSMDVSDELLVKIANATNNWAKTSSLHN